MSIYSKMIDLQKLHMAWDKVRKNKPAPGVDKVTYEEFEERKKEEIKQLHIELAEHRYVSLPVKQVDIYKGEEKRTVSLFCMRDKIVQQTIAAELSKIYEPLFSSCAYAYRSGQSALKALDMIEDKITGNQNLIVLKMDISHFFDNIIHGQMMEILKQKIRENDTLELLERSLNVAVLDEKSGELIQKEVGIYQGSVCAPILSNIYLMQYDKEMEERCEFYIRYSDDILVLGKNEEKLVEVLEFTKLYMEKLGLTLNNKKTKLHRLDKENGFAYLGYCFDSRGKRIPDKAHESLRERLETMWMTSKLEVKAKIKKGQEILGGWEQYYREERKPGDIIEYIVLLSMVQNKPETIKKELEGKRFCYVNYYRDILQYMVAYWKREQNKENIVLEYEQFFQVPDERGENYLQSDKLIDELIDCYVTLLVRPSETLYLEIMQVYMDMGLIHKAQYFLELKNQALDVKYEAVQMSEYVQDTDLSTLKVDVRDYFNLFVGREDTYVREFLKEGKRRVTEQIMEPLTEEAVKKHLKGEVTLGTYIQRQNNTAKYVVFDVDISKKILLQYPYKSTEFCSYKQKAADYTAQICKVLQHMGVKGYVEDTGYRGYHVWIFFTEWVPVRYINRLAECINEKMQWSDDDIVLEVFPNQSRIKVGKCGQSIKLPLGIHIKTGMPSYFLSDQFDVVQDYNEFFSGIARCSPAALLRVLGMYSAESEKPERTELRQVDENLEEFGKISESVEIVLQKCNLMRYLCQKAKTTGYLSHFERMSILYVFGHMGEEGKEFVHKVMSLTLNYQYNVTEKFLQKIPAKPISCVKLRDQYKLITAEYGCSCSFRRTKNCYPSPVLHAIKNAGENQQITMPVSRTIPKEKEDEVYEEINIHKQIEKYAQRIVDLKKQKRGLEKAIGKVEKEMQVIFDNASIDCLEIEMGILVRRKKGDTYEWLIEL